MHSSGSSNDLDESVHGGNFFATMFKSDSAQGFVPPSPSSDTEDRFANITMPWEVPKGDIDSPSMLAPLHHSSSAPIAIPGGLRVSTIIGDADPIFKGRGV